MKICVYGYFFIILRAKLREFINDERMNETALGYHRVISTAAADGLCRAFV